jgi:ERCC4-related helicase
MGVRDKLLGVTNPEQLVRGNTPWFRENRWNLDQGTLLVVDEVHKGCSGVDTKQGQMLALTKAWNIRVLMQSATPASSPLQMRATGYLLGLHGYTLSSFYGWCRRNGCFELPYIRGLHFSSGPKGAAQMEKIHQSIKGQIVRLRIQDIPGFPESDIQPHLYDIEEKYKKETDKIYAEMDMRLKDPTSNEMVEVLRARQRTEQFKVPLLRDLAVELLAEGWSVPIFCCFRETIEKLAAALEGVQTVRVWGEQDKEERDKAIDAFQSNRVQCLLATQAAGGVGISMHDLDGKHPRASLITPGFSASDMVQALGRVRRAGGSKSVQQIVLVAGTVEERVHRTLTKKLKCVEALRDGDLV